jgi:hypothetical protein
MPSYFAATARFARKARVAVMSTSNDTGSVMMTP